MIPRTVQMAAEVAAQFTPTQLEDYGNIILNGYATTGPNTTGKMSWAWPDSPLLPAVPLPSVTSVTPVLRGWTTNYMEYYTQLQPNGYGVNPGDPTMFEYTVHSYTPFTGPIVSIAGAYDGTGYTPGTYVGLATTTSGSGTGATLDITVGPTGDVTSIALNAQGSDYTFGDTLVPVGLGPGTGLGLIVYQVIPVGGGAPRWSQCPRRFYQNQVANYVPPNNNSQAIQYSYMYPVADNPTPPPVDTL